MPQAALSELELIRRGQMADLGGDKADVRISTKDALHADWPHRASLTYA